MMGVSAPAPGYSWPKLTLMANGWQSLRAQTEVGEGLLTTIESLGHAIESVEEKARIVCQEDGDVIAAVSSLISTYDLHPGLQSQPIRFFNTPEGSDWAARVLNGMNVIPPREDQSSTDTDNVLQAQTEALRMAGVAQQAVNDFIRYIPNTRRNESIIASINARSVARKTDIERTIADMQSLSQSVRGPSRVPNDDEPISAAREFYVKMLDKWKSFQSGICVTAQVYDHFGEGSG